MPNQPDRRERQSRPGAPCYRCADIADITLVNVVYSSQRYTPLGLLYVASVLDKAGFEVEVKDYQSSLFPSAFWDHKNLASFIGENSDIVGFSCMNDSVPLVLLAAEELKSRDPTRKVVLGGPGPTEIADPLLHKFPFVDIIVKGEAEETAPELLRQLQNDPSGLQGVDGISYRQENKVYSSKPRMRIVDLDAVPFPLWDSVDLKQYQWVTVIWGRGCPFVCTFCDVAPLWTRRNTRRSATNVVDELKQLRDRYGCEKVLFVDDTFNLNRGLVRELCGKMAEERLGMKWACECRVDLIDEELMRLMASCGCSDVFYGIESGSDKVLKQMRKGFTAEAAIERVSESLKHFTEVTSSFIWGFPYETIGDFYKTMFVAEYLFELGSQSYLHRLSLLPLSQLYFEFKDQTLPFGALPELGQFYAAEKGFTSQIRSLISAHPDIFPAFCWVQSPNLAEKARLVEDLELAMNFSRIY